VLRRDRSARFSRDHLAATIDRMRADGRLAAQARELVGSHVVPGATTDELDRIGHEFLCDHGAYPSTLGYRGFPKALCASVNEVVCHGIPDSRRILDADIVNIDVTAYLDGVHGDTNATFLAGDVDEEGRLLVERTRPTHQLIGRVIESYAARFGYGVDYDDVIEVGMTFTIEPMLNLGTREWEIWDDGWTVVTRDRRRSALFEHTLLVTPTGAEVLTAV
jgi:methionyl aminopeptidase